MTETRKRNFPLDYRRACTCARETLSRGNESERGKVEIKAGWWWRRGEGGTAKKKRLKRGKVSDEIASTLETCSLKTVGLADARDSTSGGNGFILGGWRRRWWQLCLRKVGAGGGGGGGGYAGAGP